MQAMPIKPTASRFTDDQWRAIHEEGHSLLIAASAGSGKTTVLTRRIVEKLKRGIRIDELLVITYTESAAKEMRERIETELKKEINITSDTIVFKHLQNQLLLLPQANISTIHAFCLRLIRQYFQVLTIDPVFRLMTDTTEIDLMKEQVFADLKETLYDEESFLNLAKAYSNDKYDDNLTDLIFSLHAFSQANDNPKQWLAQLSQLYTVESITNSQLFQQLIKPTILTFLKDGIMQLELAIAVLNGEELLMKSQDILMNEKAFFHSVLEMIEKDATYNTVYQMIKSFTFVRWSGAKAKDDELIKEAVNQAKRLRDSAKQTMQKISEMFYERDEETQIELLQKTKPFIEEMARVTQLFSEKYQHEKLENNVLEFSDLEHYALDILSPMQNGIRQVSDIAKLYQALFKEVMVDEYQDVNKLQESIIQCVSNGNNLFMVGDVKQSIYAFRLADPGLFLEKYTQFGQHIGGERIILAENFRSRQQVIDGVNFLFQQIMDEQVGQMPYDEAAMLKQGNLSFEKSEKFAMELLVYEKETDSVDDFIDEKAEGEIRIVAKKIQELMKEPLLINKQPLRYQDITLLVPTKKNNVFIQEIFRQYDIPVVVNESETYFQRTETMIMLSLLKLIDNPYQDIPLASVLRSPIVRLNESELAAIRINEKTADYYTALQQFLDDFRAGKLPDTSFNQQLYTRLETFVTSLEKWRKTAAQQTLMQLIWQIYEDTGLLDYVGGLPFGKQRQANLHALYERAKEYEKTRFKGLFQFIYFIERMQQKQDDLAEVSLVTGQEDAVSLMTIHASKGLEFPVVFVMDLAKQFNMKDVNGAYTFTEEYGIGTDYFDVIDKWKYKTLAHQGMNLFKRQKLLSEEMRKLYVALTRAKEKLFLVGSCKNQASYWQALDYLNEYTSVVLPMGARITSTSLFSFVQMALLRHPSVKQEYLPTVIYPSILAQHPVQFSIQFYNDDFLKNSRDTNADTSVQVSHLLQVNKETTGNNQQLYHDVLKIINYQYPYKIETETTSFQSVSELKRLVEDPDMVVLERGRGNRYVQEEFAVPKFMQKEKRISASVLGTAMHLVMQTIPLEKEMSLQKINTHIDYLVAKRLLEVEVAKKIDAMKILSFFATEFGQYLVNHASQVKREQPFSLVIQAKTLFSDVVDEKERILVHGIVDGFIEEENGIVLYDFKTDYISHQSSVDTLVERYSAQLNVYAKALENILKKPVQSVYLCALQTSENRVIPYKKSI